MAARKVADNNWLRCLREAGAQSAVPGLGFGCVPQCGTFPIRLRLLTARMRPACNLARVFRRVLAWTKADIEGEPRPNGAARQAHREIWAESERRGQRAIAKFGIGSDWRPHACVSRTQSSLSYTPKSPSLPSHNLRSHPTPSQNAQTYNIPLPPTPIPHFPLPPRPPPAYKPSPLARHGPRWLLPHTRSQSRRPSPPLIGGARARRDQDVPYFHWFVPNLPLHPQWH